MNTTVMAPTPALPPVRRPSLWEKMFNGFKINGDKNEGVDTPSISIEAAPGPTEKYEQPLSTGYEKRGSVANRRPSMAPSAKSEKSATSRHPSISSTWSRRSSRKGSWWRSSNPEADDAPPVPAIDRKFSFFSSHNPDEEELSPAASPVSSRRPSYVPRNAAASFLKTTTPLNTEEKQDVIRKASVGDMKATKLKPILVKNLELRKGSQSGLEKHSMHSMAGICEILEDAAEDETPASPTSVSPTQVKFSHKRTDSKVMRPDSTKRMDSSRPSAEVAVTKTTPEPAAVELQGSVV